MTLLFGAANAFAVGEARINGKVLDAATKEPIPDATITLDAMEAKTFHQQTKVRKDGTYNVFLIDGTIEYRLVYSAPGYKSHEEFVRLKLGEPNVKDIELRHP